MPSRSTVGLRPKQFMDEHDYHEMEKGNIQDTHNNDMHINLYFTVEQQIRGDAILSRQIYKEEQKQFNKQIKQIKTRDPMSTILIQ